MARQVRRISELPEATELTGDELLEIVQGEENHRITVGQLSGGLVENTDPRLSDSREWTATTVSQAEAEAGTATTRRAWTAQRVRQAIAAWWDSTASASGKTVATGTPALGRTALGLGTAATRDVGEASGNVMKVGAGG